MSRAGIEVGEYLHRAIPYDSTILKLHDPDPHETLVFDRQLSRMRPVALLLSILKRVKSVADQPRRAYGFPSGNVEEATARKGGNP